MRTFTIKVDVEDKLPEWILQSIKNNNSHNGITVTGMSAGDMFQRCSNLRAKLDLYAKYTNSELWGEDAQQELEYLENHYERTWETAKKLDNRRRRSYE